MEMGAILDESEQYRYMLWRKWDSQEAGITFIMLNPSTADHNVDDPTIKKCMKFARKWGFGSLTVANLFAFRAPKPVELKKAKDPVGPKNDEYLLDIIGRSSVIVAAWGVHGTYLERNVEVSWLLSRNRELRCLGTTKDGHPRHPLFLPENTALSPFYGKMR